MALSKSPTRRHPAIANAAFFRFPLDTSSVNIDLIVGTDVSETTVDARALDVDAAEVAAAAVVLARVVVTERAVVAEEVTAAAVVVASVEVVAAAVLVDVGPGTAAGADSDVGLLFLRGSRAATCCMQCMAKMPLSLAAS